MAKNIFTDFDITKMRILNCQSIINFYGIKSPYRINGVMIYPIERDITPEDIDKVKKCISDDRLLGQGLNGRVYKLDDNYVVKVPVPNRRVKDSILQETKKLDILYDFSSERKIDLQNSQRGIASFFTDSGEEYLISTYVSGAKCDKKKNRLNKYNIDSMMKILTEMDIGSEKYGRLMSYDYNGDNVNFTKKKAGIMDFEYLRGSRLNYEIPNRILTGRKSISPHLSDTSLLTSNVRTFEFGNLHYYLNTLSSHKANKLFKIYLDRKSLYHQQMSEYYAKKSKEGLFSDIFMDISNREKNHSNLLKKNNLTPDIIKSEAIKIQLAEYMYRICGSNIRGDYNPYQITDYYDNSVKYFKNKFREARKIKKYDLASYYYDCLKIVYTWSDIKNLAKYPTDYTRIVNTCEKTLDVVVKNDKKWFFTILHRLFH